MASSPAVARTFILIFSSGNISESGIYSNNTFESIMTLTVNNTAYIKYISYQIFNPAGNTFTYYPAFSVTVISTSANDTTIASDLPTLATALGVQSPIPTWSWSVTWSY